jgi:hypothetical protein
MDEEAVNFVSSEAYAQLQQVHTLIQNTQLQQELDK